MIRYLAYALAAIFSHVIIKSLRDKLTELTAMKALRRLRIEMMDGRVPKIVAYTYYT